MRTPEDLKRSKRIAIALAGLIALVMVGLGLWFIVEGHYVGTTKRGTAISLDGNAARWMGGVQICIGMLALMLAMPGKKAALRWAFFWIALGLACFVLGLRYR
jgi:ABC-type tungstate transport system substrate-binding protein